MEKKDKKNLLREYLPYIIIILVIILIRTFIITPVRVSGDSMYPTLTNGEIIYHLQLLYYHPVDQ